MTNPLDPTANYDVPKGDSKYLKFEKGHTKFLAVDSAIIGWQYWNTDNKPVRLKEEPKNPAELPGIKQEEDGRYKVTHFWAFPVVDCADGKVKILEITQKTVQSDIRAYTLNEDWGSPVMNYTFTVNREGDKFETKYTTMANPTKIIPEEWKKAWEDVQAAGFDLNALFDNGDPFAADIPDAIPEEVDTEEPPE